MCVGKAKSHPERRVEDFFKVLSGHMKMLPDHYKGLHTTSKGHAPLVDSSCHHGKT